MSSKPNSIHPRGRGQGADKPKGTARQLNAKRQERNRRNKAARADVNREYQGPNKWNSPAAYHAKLDGLSAGNGG